MDNEQKQTFHEGAQVLVEGETMPQAGSTALREDPFDDGLHDEAGIHNFLSRPVLIHSQTWAVGGTFTFDIRPVALWAANANVISKLQNYSMIKFDLEISIYVKGTVYHAGVLLVSVRRLALPNEFVTIGGDTQLITRSQRPSIQMDVGGSKTAVITIPFSNLNNYFEVADIDNGVLVLDGDYHMHLNADGYSTLAGVNTTDSITVQVFARPVNLKLAAPSETTAASSIEYGDVPFGEVYCAEACSSKNRVEGLKKTTDVKVNSKSKKAKPLKRVSRVVSRDEYQQSGPISSVAYAVASAAGLLKALPVIEPFALATEIGANAIGGIAALFGYSRPAELRSLLPVRVTPTSSLALTDAHDTVQKLSATAKQELTVDPVTVGMPNNDELSLDFLCKERFSYLNQFTWAPTDAMGDIIYYCAVTPMLERYGTVTGGLRVIPTSLSFASRAFRYWSGSLQFRIQIIGTRFHNGRIAFVYEPDVQYSGAESTNPYNSNFNFVMDLAEGLDQTFEIAWQQPCAYLRCDSYTATTNTQSTEFFTASTILDGCNGYWYAKVFNELVVADGTTGVQVLISVKAGDDFELMEPQAENIVNVSPFTYTAASSAEVGFSNFEACADEAQKEGDDFGPMPPSEVVGLASTDFTSHDLRALTYFGERIESIRSLIKRYSFYRRLSITELANIETAAYFTQFPIFRGDSTDGVDTGVVTGLPTNYFGQSFLTYFARGYGAWRGGIRYKVVDQYGNFRVLNAMRLPFGDSSNTVTPTAAYTLATLTDITITAPENLLSSVSAYTQSSSGQVLGQMTTNNGMEFEIPFQLPTRAALMSHNHWARAANAPQGYPSGDLFSIGGIYQTGSVGILDVYTAAGEDFSFYCFNGAPAMYLYAPH